MELWEKFIAYCKKHKIICFGDSWTTIDKLWHLIGCILITYFCGNITASMVGIGKEVADIGGSGMSYKDLTADAIGIIIGCGLRVLFPLNVL